jgi:phosphomannomutase / phosphoglucomutase
MSLEGILPVIMAGGAGTRLWPVSTDADPKQFQSLTGDRSTYEQTLVRVSRAEMFAPPLVITAEAFGPVALALAGRAGAKARIVLEPARRDSAAAVATAAVMAAEASPDTLVLVLASDHQIDGDALFLDAVHEGATAARRGSIVVFGITPSEPRTSYGYIRPGRTLPGSAFTSTVEAFVEKPDLETARRYVAEGYLWNSGNFLFRAGTMIEAFRSHAPQVLEAATAALRRASEHDGCLRLDAQAFAAAPRTSVDYAIMEKVQDIAVVAGRFGWSDIGSWDAVWQVLPHDGQGNAVIGGGVVHDSANCLIHAPGKTVVAAGVADLAVVATGDTVLVIPKNRAQDVKKIAELVAARAPARPAAGFPAPVAALAPNTPAFETTPLVKPTGFREYDARWWFGHPASAKAPELNLMGAQALGLGLGTFLAERGAGLDIVTGHDYRSYSLAIKQALTQGLMASGARVHDIGLAITPMAYFAQFDLDVPAVAMVTASHNENGWTGVKMGCERPVTFGPDEMQRLKDIVLGGRFRLASGGGYRFVGNFSARYQADLTARPKIVRRLKVVVACGNGTAGAFAPAILEALGVDVIPLHCTPDHSFPNYNPNPEDMAMLHDIAHAVKAHGADVGLGFDGDGDRCGVVDNEGNEIFADKIGLMLARDLAGLHPGARFVVDVKSTCLYAGDQVLAGAGATTDYYKTGHSYIKRRVKELAALAGFEKSGHFFFNAPVGRGYDDGLVTAIAILDMLDRNPQASMADLYRALPRTWGSPTMSAHCGDDVKYGVVERFTARIRSLADAGGQIAGHAITSINLVNGVRVTTDDGTWGLVRASSNKPELVVVIESPVAEARLRQMFKAMDDLLRLDPEVGAYNQTI